MRKLFIVLCLIGTAVMVQDLQASHIKYQALVEKTTGNVLTSGYYDVSKSDGYNSDSHTIIFNPKCKRCKARIPAGRGTARSDTEFHRFDFSDLSWSLQLQPQ